MRDDIAEMRDDFAEMRDDIAEMRDDIAEMRDDIAEMRDDFAEIRDDIAETNNNTVYLRDDELDLLSRVHLLEIIELRNILRCSYCTGADTGFFRGGGG